MKRNRFALPKLIARIARREKPLPAGVDRVLLADDRDQSAIENYTVCIWFCATVVVYIAAALPLQFPLALLAAIPLTAIAIEIPIYAGGNSFVLMLLHFLASAYFVSHSGPAFYVAYFSLTIFFTNWVARIVNAICGI
jgi:tetrahydromethanopterin S-methyltransferase subunit E